MTIPAIRQKAFATQKDEEDAIQLLNASVDPILARIKEDVIACRDAVGSSQVILLSESQGISEDVVLALGHHGDAFLGSLRMSIRNDIAQLRNRQHAQPAKLEGALPRLELVGHHRVNEDIAASALIHRLHATSQEQSQSLAIRVSRIWPKAYITETDVPSSAHFQVSHILAALRSIDRDFMTSEARVVILGTLVLKWLNDLNEYTKKSNDELSIKGWVPKLESKDISSWKRHLARLSGVNDPRYSQVSRKENESQDAGQSSEQGANAQNDESASPVEARPIAPHQNRDEPLSQGRVYAQPPAYTAAREQTKQSISLSALHYSNPREHVHRDEGQAFSSQHTLQSSALDAIDNTMSAQNAYQHDMGAFPAHIGSHYQQEIQQSLIPMPHGSIEFIEPLLSHLQELAKGIDKPVLIDTTKIIKKEAAKRGIEEVSDALVQRLVAAQNMMRTLMSDDSIQDEIKTILVKLQLPWTRYLLQSGDAIANANDPFKDLLWKVCAIGRRSSSPEEDGTNTMLRSTVAFFDKANTINESVILKALNFINLKCDDIRRKAKLVVERSVMSWQGQAAIMESRQNIKNELEGIIGSSEIPASFAAVISESIIPSLLLFSLKKEISEHESRRHDHARIWVKHYIEMRLHAQVAEIEDHRLAAVYLKCSEIIKEAGNRSAALDADKKIFLAVIAAARSEHAKAAKKATQAQGDALQSEATPPIARNELKVFTSTVIVPEVEVKGPEDICSADNLKKAKEIAIGSWLQASIDGKEWRGRIAARISFKDTIIVVDRNGTKVAEMTHASFGKSLDAKEIRIIEDVTSFSRAIESMVMSVRKYKPV